MKMVNVDVLTLYLEEVQGESVKSAVDKQEIFEKSGDESSPSPKLRSKKSKEKNPMDITVSVITPTTIHLLLNVSYPSKVWCTAYTTDENIDDENIMDEIKPQTVQSLFFRFFLSNRSCRVDFEVSLFQHRVQHLLSEFLHRRRNQGIQANYNFSDYC